MLSMARIGMYALVGAAALTAGSLTLLRAQAPDPETAIGNALRVQDAMASADAYLLAGDPGKAVDVLEEMLPRINGNHKYLAKLRDAYRAYIPKLYADRQPAQAKKYLERLSILDHSAVGDPSLQPAVEMQAGAAPEVTAPPAHGPTLVEMAQASGAPPDKAPIKARGSMEDPFDRSNAANPAAADALAREQIAQQLLAKAESEFKDRHYSQARRFYEQAFHADQACTLASRDRWAYCKMNYVVEQLNRADLDPATWADLEREVKAAVELAPRLADTGRWLEGELRSRRGSTGGAVAIRHLGSNAQGWEVAETANFRIFHKSNRDLAEKAAQTVERTRTAMYQKWFSAAAVAWNPKCDLYLHATAQDYSRITAQQPTSPGHSTIVRERGSSRIVSRRMDMHCDTPTMLDTVLPHETTHVVLAGNFGNSDVPRWADEGMAVLTEPAEKVDMHRRNLAHCQQENRLFSVAELMQLDNYPPAGQISAFYAQSVSLVDFLSNQRGPAVFAQFVRDGLREGYEPALRKHYGFRDFADLQTRWGQQTLAGLSSPPVTVAGQ
jgi:hypothetical protein